MRRLTLRHFPPPRSTRQRARQEALARLQVYRLLGRMEEAERLAYDRERQLLTRGTYFPPHHMEAHVPSQGCLFCWMELAEIVLARRKPI